MHNDAHRLAPRRPELDESTGRFSRLSYRLAKLLLMASPLTSDQKSTVTVLLHAGKTVKEIAGFADLDRDAVTEIARKLDLEPDGATKKRAKALFGSSDGFTYADVANALSGEGLDNDGESVHYLTVATWVANHGWPWGGAKDGEYAPDRSASSPSRSRYTLRMSKAMAEEVNDAKAIAAAADAAWDVLRAEDGTTIVAVAVVQGAAAAGVTDLAAVKSSLMERHGEELRTAKA